jgi:hypothetical protein
VFGYRIQNQKFNPINAEQMTLSQTTDYLTGKTMPPEEAVDYLDAPIIEIIHPNMN